MNKIINFPLTLILKAGFLVGTLDILAAFADYYLLTGKGPDGVLRFIASGMFGAEAFSGGTAMMVWGLIFHFIIAYAFTILYFWLYSQLKFVSKHPLLFAILYAFFMWAVTHLMVMPLSMLSLENRRDLQFLKIIKATAILFFMICVPLSLIARKYFEKKR